MGIKAAKIWRRCRERNNCGFSQRRFSHSVERWREATVVVHDSTRRCAPAQQLRRCPAAHRVRRLKQSVLPRILPRVLAPRETIRDSFDPFLSLSLSLSFFLVRRRHFFSFGSTLARTSFPRHFVSLLFFHFQIEGSRTTRGIGIDDRSMIYSLRCGYY